MKFVAVLTTAMGLLTISASGSPVSEPVEGNIQSRACVSIQVFQEFDYRGASYDECLAPREVHQIRQGFRNNAGSFKVNSPGYVCTPGTPENQSCDGATQGDGISRLPGYCVNNLGNYYCNFTD